MFNSPTKSSYCDKKHSLYFEAIVITIICRPIFEAIVIIIIRRPIFISYLSGSAVTAELAPRVEIDWLWQSLI